MAIKEKQTEQKSKLLEVLKNEYKGESLILGALAIITAGLAVLIITRVQGFIIPPDFPIIGGSPNDMIFAYTVLTVAILGIALVVYPFFLPAIPEIKKIQWATLPQFIDYSLRTLLFIVVLTLIIAAYDVIITRIVEWLQ